VLLAWSCVPLYRQCYRTELNYLAEFKASSRFYAELGNPLQAQSTPDNHEWEPAQRTQSFFDCVRRFSSSDQFKTTYIWVAGAS
jgi:hypothetical protein